MESFDKNPSATVDELLSGPSLFLFRLVGLSRPHPPLILNAFWNVVEIILSLAVFGGLFIISFSMALDSLIVYPNVLTLVLFSFCRPILVHFYRKSDKLGFFPPSSKTKMNKMFRWQVLTTVLFYPIIGVPIIFAILNEREEGFVISTLDSIGLVMYWSSFALVELISAPTESLLSVGSFVLRKEADHLLEKLPVRVRDSDKKAKIAKDLEEKRKEAEMDDRFSANRYCLTYEQALSDLADLDEHIRLENSMFSVHLSLKLLNWFTYILSYIFIAVFQPMEMATRLLLGLMVIFLLCAILIESLPPIRFNSKLDHLSERANRIQPHDSGWTVENASQFAHRAERIARLTAWGTPMTFEVLWSFIVSLSNIGIILAGLGFS